MAALELWQKHKRSVERWQTRRSSSDSISMVIMLLPLALAVVLAAPVRPADEEHPTTEHQQLQLASGTVTQVVPSHGRRLQGMARPGEVACPPGDRTIGRFCNGPYDFVLLCSASATDVETPQVVQPTPQTSSSDSNAALQSHVTRHSGPNPKRIIRRDNKETWQRTQSGASSSRDEDPDIAAMIEARMQMAAVQRRARPRGGRYTMFGGGGGGIGNTAGFPARRRWADLSYDTIFRFRCATAHVCVQDPRGQLLGLPEVARATSISCTRQDELDETVEWRGGGLGGSSRSLGLRRTVRSYDLAAMDETSDDDTQATPILVPGGTRTQTTTQNAETANAQIPLNQPGSDPNLEPSLFYFGTSP